MLRTTVRVDATNIVRISVSPNLYQVVQAKEGIQFLAFTQAKRPEIKAEASPKLDKGWAC